MLTNYEKISGLLLGTAVGDSLGLPYEGLSKSTISSILPRKLNHSFLFNKGMLSDDTEHMVLTAEALLSEPCDINRFKINLGWKLRGWLLALPFSTGAATLKACIRLCIGFSPEKSGVFSAGNGPGMRAAILGVFFSNSNEKLALYLSATSQITHKDPLALTGADAIASLSKWGYIHNESTLSKKDLDDIVQILHLVNTPNNSEWKNNINIFRDSYMSNQTVQQYAKKIGAINGVSGFVNQSIPVAIFSWVRHFGNFNKTVRNVILCGGDTDSTAAVAGALAGVTVGINEIPKNLIKNIVDFPISINYLNDLAIRITMQKENGNAKSKRTFFPALLVRNIFFFQVLLAHVFLRLWRKGANAMLKKQ